VGIRFLTNFKNPYASGSLKMRDKLKKKFFSKKN